MQTAKDCSRKCAEFAIGQTSATERSRSFHALTHRLTAGRLHRPDREECLRHGRSDQIEPLLKVVNELVESAGDDLVGTGIGQLGPELPQELFGPISETLDQRTGNRVQRLVALGKAVKNG